MIRVLLSIDYDFKNVRISKLTVAFPITRKDSDKSFDIFIQNDPIILHYKCIFILSFLKKVQVKNAEIVNPRLHHGVYITYTNQHRTNNNRQQTPVMKTRSPNFNHSQIISFEKFERQHLEWLECGYLSFDMFALQTDDITDQKRLKMSTKQLRNRRERKLSLSTNSKSSFEHMSAECHLKSDLILYKRRYERMEKKEQRLKDLLDEWKGGKDFEGFYRAVHAAVHHKHGMMKYKVNLLRTSMKNEDGEGGGGANGVKEIKSITLCEVM